MKTLTEQERHYLIELLQNGKDIPYDFKEKIFPTVQKEYELVYGGKMRKEDLLADEDGTISLPLQIEKSFNGKEYKKFKGGWQNIMVCGDNLQFLKTIYKNEDELIKNKVKGKVKLIYIDPPFATTDDFQGTGKEKAYADKKKSAQFVEILRRRLILAREILADDGSIYVHLDQKMSHYIKLVLDEVFGKQNFRNEIIWDYYVSGKYPNYFARNHASIYLYSKTSNPIFNYHKKFDENLYYKKFHEDDIIEKDGKLHYTYNGELRTFDKQLSEVWSDISKVKRDSTLEKTGYPTQKPEKLLRRIIEASSNPGDIVMDFFGGSGTTIAVAEKLDRKWITCDIGKFSHLTMQKRILQIGSSKDLNDEDKDYGKKPKSFLTARFGTYDWKEVIDLEWERYKKFVAQLFEVKLGIHRIAGHEFEGKKDGYPVMIFNYAKYKDSGIDTDYLKQLHSSIGKKAGSRVYIIAPANSIDFIADYEEIGKVRYYFLKIPYTIIEELHKGEFRKIRQPKSRSKINDLDQAIGFHFIRQPEVKARIKKNGDKVTLVIEDFQSKELFNSKDESESDLQGFETLSAIFIDRNYDGKAFMMDDVYFGDEIEKEITFEKSDLGKKIMVIYTDIYGNDFTEIHPI